MTVYTVKLREKELESLVQLFGLVKMVNEATVSTLHDYEPALKDVERILYRSGFIKKKKGGVVSPIDLRDEVMDLYDGLVPPDPKYKAGESNVEVINQ